MTDSNRPQKQGFFGWTTQRRNSEVSGNESNLDDLQNPYIVEMVNDYSRKLSYPSHLRVSFPHMFLELKIQVLPNSWRCMEQKTTTAWISTFAGSLLWWLRFLLTELLRTCKIRPSKFELQSLGWLLVSRPMVSTQQACSCQSPLQTLPLLLWFLSCLFPHHLLWFSTLLRLISESPTPAKSNMTMFEDVYPIKNRDCPMLFCCFQRCKLSTLYSFHWAWIVPRKKNGKQKAPWWNLSSNLGNLL